MGRGTDRQTDTERWERARDGERKGFVKVVAVESYTRCIRRLIVLVGIEKPITFIMIKFKCKQKVE